MPTNRLQIKFSKTVFLNILKYEMKHACLHMICYHEYAFSNQPTTFKFPQRSVGRTNPVKIYLYQN